MAENTDPQVLRYAAEQVRPRSDEFYQLYYRCKGAIESYNVDDIGTLINNAGAGNFLADGSATDGRTRITGGDIFNFETLMSAFVAFVEGGAVATLDRTDVIAKPHVNGI